MSSRPIFFHDMKNLLGIALGYTNLMLDELPADDAKRADLEQVRKAGEEALALLEQWAEAVHQEK